MTAIDLVGIRYTALVGSGTQHRPRFCADGTSGTQHRAGICPAGIITSRLACAALRSYTCGRALSIKKG